MEMALRLVFLLVSLASLTTIVFCQSAMDEAYANNEITERRARFAKSGQQLSETIGE